MTAFRIVPKLLLFISLALLVSCSTIKNKMYTPNPGNPAITQINATMQQDMNTNENIAARSERPNIPADVGTALLPSLDVDAPSQKGQELESQRFDISVNDAPANTFFMGLVKGTKYNMVVSPEIKGTITLNLQNVTIQEVLDAVQDIYGYQYEKTPYGFQVYPSGLQTRIFTLNYINVSRTGQSSTSISSGQISQKITTSGTAVTEKPTSNVITTTTSDFWKELATTLQAMIGTADGRQVVVNSQSGTVIVKAFPDELNQVQQYLDSIQATMTRQVIIEAKILEVQLLDDFQSGIDWKLLGLQQTSEEQNSDIMESVSKFNSIFKLRASSGSSFSFMITLLSRQGNVQTLASPRIATLNNQKAVIKIGTDKFYITDVQSNVTAANQPITSQNVEFTPFFSGISLDVTPEIDAHGGVILHIHPVVSVVSEDIKKYTIGQSNGSGSQATEQQVPMASTDVRESDSIVHADNGQIIVIGGLMKNDTKEATSSVPFADKTPIIGPLFRRTAQVSEKSELVILLRPVVVNSTSSVSQLRQSAQQFKNLNRGFHIGSHPDIFGNLGEPETQKRLKQQGTSGQYSK